MLQADVIEGLKNVVGIKPEIVLLNEKDVMRLFEPKDRAAVANRLQVSARRWKHTDTVVFNPDQDYARFLTGTQQHWDLATVLTATYPEMKPRVIQPYTENGKLVVPRFVGLKISGADFSGITIRFGDFLQTSIKTSDLSGVVLDGCKMNESSIIESSLVALKCLNMSGRSKNEPGNFKEANLQGSNLTGAFMMGVDARQTHFDEATVTDTDLTDARLLDTTWWGSKGTPKVNIRSLNKPAVASFKMRQLKEVDVHVLHNLPSSGAMPGPADVGSIERLNRAQLIEYKNNKYRPTRSAAEFIQTLKEG